VTLRSASVQGSRCSAGAAILRGYLSRVDVNRPKHIDDYIDYFGNGSAPEEVPRQATPRGERDNEGASGVSARLRP